MFDRLSLPTKKGYSAKCSSLNEKFVMAEREIGSIRERDTSVRSRVSNFTARYTQLYPPLDQATFRNVNHSRCS